MSGRRFALACVLLVCWLGSGVAGAHGFRPGVLTLTETQPGRFAMTWTEPVDTRGPGPRIEPRFPTQCRRENGVVDCGGSGLHGELVFEGLDEQRAPIAVAVTWLDGTSIEVMVEPDDPAVELGPSAGRFVAPWIELGVEHIIGGLDHVAFVLGLLLVVGASNLRRLVATITAFTLAHSVTLALAVLGLLTLPSAPVEATIAASVVLVAREGTHDADTITRRAPWAVALLFGLVHGLGFAGALTETALPTANLGSALLGFNLGVELGQLAIVFAVIATVRLLPPSTHRLRLPACYAIGILGTWWLIDRTAAIVTM